MNKLKAALSKVNNPSVNYNHIIKQIRLSMFEQQQKFVDDKDDKVAHCSRRASKTFSAGIDIILTGLEKPRTNILFLGLTFDSAKDIIVNDIIDPMNEFYNIGLDIQTDRIIFPNKSICYIRGLAGDKKQNRRIVGKKYKLVVIDEAQDMAEIDLESIINNKIRPMTIDSGGRILITGTSTDILDTFFYKLTINKHKSAAEHGYNYHFWSVFDNPYNRKNAEIEIEKQLKLNPDYKSTKAFRNQYLAEWVVDDNKLVYKYKDYNFTDPKTNQPYQLPTDKLLFFVLGVDFGWEDPDAYAELAWSPEDKSLYICSVFVQNKLNAQESSNILYEMAKRRNYTKIVCDGAEPKTINLLKERLGDRVVSAEKTSKFEYQMLFNQDLESGLIKVLPQCKDAILAEASKLIKNPNKPKEDHPSYENHVCDSILYSWRFCNNFFSKEPQEVKQDPETLKQIRIQQAIKNNNRSGIFDRLSKSNRKVYI